ncbi:peptidase M48, Ste24p [Thermoproteus uzoniensis 768-20]|uniref:Peptidase M48, Ste24p n=1 Tax=Thermoproteus uzoniensis (strain 768-20) TaxID=999630 RepID=F2L1Z2_THEU7|nr:M48 family metalloprotease [Thermoproteus uzoniensis]AEA11733.1 peptidase M48, Ste24p [Thermoproteus uzoniensis 768-20]
MYIDLSDQWRRLGLGSRLEVRDGVILADGEIIEVNRPKLRSLRARAAYLLYLRELARDDRYNVAIIGAWKSGKLIEPPEIKVNPLFLFLPFLISMPPALLVHHLSLQLVVGISAIIASYIALFLYLKSKCIKVDYITIIKTKYKDLNFLKKNKKEILENPAILGEYEAYHFKARGICVVKDRTANAMSFETPFGSIILATTGLLARLKPEEIEAALKHEEGHIRLHHMYKILLFLISEFILRIYLINYIYANISLYLIGIHLIGASLLYTALIRLYEYEADRYAGSRHLATGLLKVGWNEVVEEVLYPAYSRLKFLVKTHPNTLDRVLRIWTW